VQVKAYYQQLNTVLGKLHAVADDDHVIYLGFREIMENDLFKDMTVIEQTNQVLELAKSELAAYFQGRLAAFSVPYKLQGTVFQKKVWQELSKIPYGTTLNYEEVAKRIGHIKACRAVGQANNRNPVAIIVPCHRVIGKNGGLVGYAGGLDIKTRLLEWEKNKRQGICFEL